jgi:outer membrane protein OmpA-like peptidoglycan-associated protein
VLPSRRLRGLTLFLALAIAACASVDGPPASTLPLRQVVLYRNGLGYFEHAGRLENDHLKMRLRANEVDDVMKTLVVLSHEDRAAVGSVASLKKANDDGDVDLDLAVATNHDITVSYAAPTPAWRSTYKLVLSDGGGGLLQTWAVVDNASEQDWRDVRLTLATGAPFSYAVDLHTAQFVARPDATGRLVTPPLNGTVAPERSTPGDRDGDRIPDAIDACPDEPETYNGYQDADGCPDQGHAGVGRGRPEIVDKIYFERGRHEFKPIDQRLLDVIAATIKGNPRLELLEVQGHTSSDEADAAAVSGARAAVVRGALIKRGVAAARLTMRAYGATHSLCAQSTEDCRTQNRRVELFVLKGEEPAELVSSLGRAPGPMPVTVGSAEKGVQPVPTLPSEVAGMVRYEIGVPVSIPGRSSAMVAIQSRRLDAAEVYFYRPDSNAPGSDSHPFRAARFECPAGSPLEAGPLAIYARGTFVGDAIVDRLQPGEVSLVPFALDGSSNVRASQETETEPARLVKIAHGVFSVEDRAILRTRYEVTAGPSPPARIYVRHALRAGYELGPVPSGSEPGQGADIVPLTLGSDGKALLAVEESRPVRRDVNLNDGQSLDLEAYLKGTSELPPALADRLRRLQALRAAADHLDVEQELLRREIDDSAQRLAELRDNLSAVAKNPSAGKLRKELTDGLAEAARANEDLSKRQAALIGERDQKRAQVRSQLEDLAFE